MTFSLVVCGYWGSPAGNGTTTKVLLQYPATSGWCVTSRDLRLWSRPSLYSSKVFPILIIIVFGWSLNTARFDAIIESVLVDHTCRDSADTQYVIIFDNLN